MTPEQANIAIAEICKVHLKIVCQSCQGEWRTWACEECDQNGLVDIPPPNYFGNLDAMGEAEEVAITHHNILAYHQELLAVVIRERKHDPLRKWPMSICINAKASERAEAFLRVHKKWIETKPNKTNRNQ